MLAFGFICYPKHTYRRIANYCTDCGIMYRVTIRYYVLILEFSVRSENRFAGNRRQEPNFGCTRALRDGDVAGL